MSLEDNEKKWESRGEKEFDKFTNHPFLTSIKWLGGFLAIVLVLSIIGNVFGIVGIYWQAEKAKITAHPRVINKIYETENIIAEVAKFHDECTNVKRELNVFQNNYQRYLADKEAAKSTEGLERVAAIQALPNDVSDYTAPLNAAQAEAEQYDSNSAQYTQNEFKSHNLPYRIELPAGTTAAYHYEINCN